MLDTGAMYRALALAAVRAGVASDSAADLEHLASRAMIGFEPDSPDRVLLDGEDVSGAIRTLEMGQMASAVSVHPGVRHWLVRRQQEIIQPGGFVLEGRDTTTVVAPGADLKVFLTASIEERARRRWLELKAKGEMVQLQEVVVDVVERDHRDYSRPDSPLALAEDAVIVETYGVDPSEVVETILRHLGERPDSAR